MQQLTNEQLNIFNSIIVKYQINSKGSAKRLQAAKSESTKEISQLTTDERTILLEYLGNRIDTNICDYPSYIRKELYLLTASTYKQ
jgi:hypothetical protein